MPSVTYSCVLQVRPSTVMILARVLQQRREVIGTRAGRRALSPRPQAVLVLRRSLDGTRIKQSAADNAIGVSTRYRHLHEAAAALAFAAPDIHEALTAAVTFDATHINLDGTSIHTDRHRIPTLTDLGYLNLSPPIRHPHKKPQDGELTEEQKAYNALIRGVHGIGERANALPKKTLHTLALVSPSPTRIGGIAKAALVLRHLEHNRPLPGGYPA